MLLGFYKIRIFQTFIVECERRKGARCFMKQEQFQNFVRASSIFCINGLFSFLLGWRADVAFDQMAEPVVSSVIRIHS